MELQKEKVLNKVPPGKGTLGKNTAEGDEGEPVRVSLVMVNRLLRETLVHVLRRRGHMELAVCGEPSEEGLKEIAGARSEVLLVDFVNADWLCRLGAEEEAALSPRKVVAIGMEPDKDAFLEAVRCGVCGYLLKDAGANEVVAAVRAAKRGEAFCSPQMCTMLFQAVAELKAESSKRKLNEKAALTIRQRMLMKLVAKGLTNKEIAAQLNLSEFTVRNHVSRILKQLHAETRSAAVDSMRESQYELSA